MESLVEISCDQNWIKKDSMGNFSSFQCIGKVFIYALTMNILNGNQQKQNTKTTVTIILII